MPKLITKINNAKITRLLLLILLSSSVFYTGCSISPDNNDITIIDKTPLKKITPVEQLEQEIKQITSLKQPAKNKAYFNVLAKLFDRVITNDLSYDPQFYNEYRLLDQVLSKIDKNSLSPLLGNKNKLLSALYFTLKNNYSNAEYFLQQNLSTLTPPEKILFYRLKAKTLASDNKLDDIKAAIYLHKLYEDYVQHLSSGQLHYQSKNVLANSLEKKFMAIADKDIEQARATHLQSIENKDILSFYLSRIWNLFSRLTKEELKTVDATSLLGSEPLLDNSSINQSTNLSFTEQEYIDQQIVGWKNLFLLIKKNTSQYILSQQVNLWVSQFPAHMLKKSFIVQQLKQHFEQMIQAKQIALLLPLSGKYANVSQTIQHGFLAAHFQNNQNNLTIRVYDTSSSDSIWPVYRKAVDEGAEVIVGPLRKNLLNDLADEAELPVITLALNNANRSLMTTNKAKTDTDIGKDIVSSKASDTVPSVTPDIISNIAPSKTKNLFQFSLKPEDEINLITQEAKSQGYMKAAIITSDSKLGVRMRDAYNKNWQDLGGQVVSQQNYQSKAYDFAEPITQLLNVNNSTQRSKSLRQTIGSSIEFTPRIRQDIDVIFLAASPSQAKQIPLQIKFHHGGDLPIYANSQIIGEAFDVQRNKNLNGIIYPDMPWLIDSTLPAISRLATEKNTSLQRLFTFGVDSYLIIPYLNLLQQKRLDSLSGESGLLTITDNGLVKRKMSLAIIKRGISVALDNNSSVNTLKNE